MSLSTTAPTVAGIVEALERDSEELARIRHDARLDFRSLHLQTNKVAIHAARHILGSASTDGSPFAWLTGHGDGWQTWDRLAGQLCLRPDQPGGTSDSELVKLLEFPVTFYLMGIFPNDDEGMIEWDWPPNKPAPRVTDIDREQIRNRGLEAVCRNAATLLREMARNGRSESAAFAASVSRLAAVLVGTTPQAVAEPPGKANVELEKKPVWDGTTLSYDGITLKVFKKHPAQNQKMLFNAFRSADWHNTIQNPWYDPKLKNQTRPLRTLNETLRAINKTIANSIRFEALGDGQCRWIEV